MFTPCPLHSSGTRIPEHQKHRRPPPALPLQAPPAESATSSPARGLGHSCHVPGPDLVPFSSCKVGVRG